MKDFSKKVISCILAFMTCFSFEEMLKVNSDNFAFSNSVFSIVFFVVFVVFFHNYVLKIIEKRLLIISAFVGILFSFFLIAGSNILLNDATELTSIKTWIYILGGTPFWAGCVALLIKNVNNIEEACRLPIFERLAVKPVFSQKSSLMYSWIFIFLCWLPGLIATYPGIYGYDSVFQLGFYIDKKIDLWHPLAHTYLMGICIEDIGGLLGSREAGLFVYSIIQMIFLAGVFALIIYYMTKKNAPVLLRIGMLFVAAFLPTNALMSFSCTKDVPFAAFLCLVTYLAMRIAEEEQFLAKKRNIALLLLSFVGIIIFRNQGIYVIVLGLIIGLLLLRNQWKRFVVLLVATVVFFSAYSGPITDALGGVEPSKGVEEMLSVPIMQLSRAVCYYGTDLSDEEIELAEKYIPEIHEYDTKGEKGIADYFKEEFNSKRFHKNPLEFVKLWAKVGLKVPTAYIDAFARLSIGLWYPDMNYRDSEAYHPYWEYENTPQILEEWILLERTTPKCLQWLSDFYYNITYYNTYQNLPVVSMLFSSGFVVWLLIIYVAWCIYKKEYKLLFPASFLTLYWLTMLLGPVVIYRYLYPLMISIPVLFTKVITNKEQ